VHTSALKHQVKEDGSNTNRQVWKRPHGAMCLPAVSSWCWEYLNESNRGREVYLHVTHHPGADLLVPFTPSRIKQTAWLKYYCGSRG